MVGNLYLGGAQPSAEDKDALVLPGFSPGIELVTTGTEGEGGRAYLSFVMPAAGVSVMRAMVTTEILGKARLSGVAYENPDGTALQLDRDYLGKARGPGNPTVGPFEGIGQGEVRLRVW